MYHFSVILIAVGIGQNAEAQSPITSLSFAEISKPEWKYIHDVAVSPDGRWVVAASDTGLYLLNQDLTGFQVLAGHEGSVDSVDWNADGTLLASGGDDGTIRIWDMQEGSPDYLTSIQTLQDNGPIFNVSWSPDLLSHRIATRTLTRWEQSSDSVFIQTDIRVWNKATGQIECTLGVLANSAMKVTWSPDGNFLAIAGEMAGIGGWVPVVWDVQTGNIIAQETVGHLDKITTITWRPDSQVVAYTSATGIVNIFDVQNSRVIYSLGAELMMGSVNVIDWSPDGTYFVVAGDENRLMIYDADLDKVVSDLKSLPDFVYTLDWSDDGTKIAALIGYDTLRLYDLVELPLHTGTAAITPYPSETPTLVSTP